MAAFLVTRRTLLLGAVTTVVGGCANYRDEAAQLSAWLSRQPEVQTVVSAHQGSQVLPGASIAFLATVRLTHGATARELSALAASIANERARSKGSFTTWEIAAQLAGGSVTLRETLDTSTKAIELFTALRALDGPPTVAVGTDTVELVGAAQDTVAKQPPSPGEPAAVLALVGAAEREISRVAAHVDGLTVTVGQSSVTGTRPVPVSLVQTLVGLAPVRLTMQTTPGLSLTLGYPEDRQVPQRRTALLDALGNGWRPEPSIAVSGPRLTVVGSHDPGIAPTVSLTLLEQPGVARARIDTDQKAPSTTFWLSSLSAYDQVLGNRQLDPLGALSLRYPDTEQPDVETYGTADQLRRSTSGLVPELGAQTGVRHLSWRSSIDELALQLATLGDWPPVVRSLRTHPTDGSRQIRVTRGPDPGAAAVVTPVVTFRSTATGRAQLVAVGNSTSRPTTLPSEAQAVLDGWNATATA